MATESSYRCPPVTNMSQTCTASEHACQSGEGGNKYGKVLCSLKKIQVAVGKQVQAADCGPALLDAQAPAQSCNAALSWWQGASVNTRWYLYLYQSALWVQNASTHGYI